MRDLGGYAGWQKPAVLTLLGLGKPCLNYAALIGGAGISSPAGSKA